MTPDVRLAILEGDAAAGIGFARRGARVARTAGPPLETVLIAMAKVRLAMAAMGKPKTKVADLCRELGVTRQTLYRHVSPVGTLRQDGANFCIGSEGDISLVASLGVSLRKAPELSLGIS